VRRPTAAIALIVLLILLATTGCADEEQREWRTATDPRASVDEIIDNGNASGIAGSGDRLLVTWVVDPEDDEGSSQGAWRLYDTGDGSRVADGSFGQVREASARMGVWAVNDGFVLQDYVKHRFHHVSRAGKLRSISVDAKPPTSLAGGQFVPDDEGEGLGRIGFAVLPDGRVTRLGTSPTDQGQDSVLATDGELWIGLPWADGEARRYVHARNGRGPWVRKTMPLPEGSSTWSYSMSAGRDRLFVPILRGESDRVAVSGFMTTKSDGTGGWHLISADGISAKLTVPPRVQVLPDGRLFASTGGEGAWIRQPSGRWSPIRGLKTAPHSDADVRYAAGRLWSSEWSFGHSLKYSTDYGRTWTDFRR